MTTTGAGRPRLKTRTRPGATAREEILDAAAELFTTRGFTGTSTRMIADAVGIRQASMYHHFATKDDILAALLLDTVAGPLACAEMLRKNCPDPSSASTRSHSSTPPNSQSHAGTSAPCIYCPR